MPTKLLIACLFLVACGSSPEPGDAGVLDASAFDAAVANPLDAGDNDASATNDAATSTDASSSDLAGQGGTNSLISQATCSPSPCTAGTGPTGASSIQTYPTPPTCPKGPIAGTTNIIGLGAINNGATSDCRVYGYYRPKNLVGNATAVFTAAGSGGVCGSGKGLVLDGSNWFSVADANRLVVILLSYCPSNAWKHPYIDVPDPGTTPSDTPYLKAVIADAMQNPAIGIDPSRLILAGGSSGGSLAWGTACDPTASTLFRGYGPYSAPMQEQVDSSGNPVLGSERCSSANKQYFISAVMGDSDPTGAQNGKCTTGTPTAHCTTSFAESARFFAQHLGCAATPTTTMIGTPQALNRQDLYGSCPFGGQQLETILVKNGGHNWANLDDASNGSVDTNGFDTARSIWDFLSTRRW